MLGMFWTGPKISGVDKNKPIHRGWISHEEFFWVVSHIFLLYLLYWVGEPLFNVKCQNFKFIFYLVGLKMSLFTIFVSDFKSDEALFCLKTFTWDLRWFYSITWIYRDTWSVSLFLSIRPSSNLIFAKIDMLHQSIFLLTENCMQVNDFSDLLTQSSFTFSSIFY